MDALSNDIQDKSPPSNLLKSSNLRKFNGHTILVGPLPDDFLRIDLCSNSSCSVGKSQLEIDEQLAASLQQQYNQQAQRHQASRYQAQLMIKCVEAKLTKNYGLVNMNPYIRLRLGHTIFETKTR